MAGGLAAALPASYLLYRRFPYYRALQPSLKALGVILVAVPACVITAERASQAFERAQWHDRGKTELDTIKAREAARWGNMSAAQKAGDFVKRHEYGVIVGSWAAAMAGTLTYIMRDKIQTVPQKVVQARMWAQGLTIGIIIAAGVLTHSQRAKRFEEEIRDGHLVRHLPEDHSWKDILEEEERERAASGPGDGSRPS
ncbi:uncharacterized protein BXZ73DRAFT_80645 [Epithele typhae]|uniref:uncharacterized protein n=1 Tax=Epithele typhae TaxID=378194 RepID=UPI00200749DF|nr:uncharacterized protein BXZ73DRAFT_80645 [Epithele typhae]KAH9918178.1 hypothetical protein BXZ73DRAFT_80645 [Epithele typhae]